MNRKKNILYVGEFSGLNTGYACISRNLLRKFHDSGKYNISELACYCKDNEPIHIEQKKQFPWRILGNLPTNEHEDQIYKSNPSNEFGKWKLEYACLETAADILISVRDYWMDLHIDQSPFRRLYKTVMMPTVDAASQSPEWLDFYKRSDAILTYTDFSYKVLEQEGGGLIPLKGVTTPAVDIDLFKPVQNKKEHKARWGINPESIIVGIVARNQKRKLYPDLSEAFSEFLSHSKYLNTDNVLLYFHCAHPDVGWDIPRYIKDNGLSRKVLMTYFCHACKAWFPSFYTDATTICLNCKQKSAALSNSNIGIDNNALASVYNFIDLYVQFVTNEGLGIPALEAAACGCPVVGTYYSGVEDVINKLEGKAIKVRSYFHEAETGRIMSLPSVDELVDYIEYFTRLPESIRLRMGLKSLELCRKHFGGWDKVAQTWMDTFDSFEIQQNPWLSPIDYVPVERYTCPGPDKMNDEQFISYVLGEVLHRTDWINSHVGLRLLRDLSWGRTTTNTLGFAAGDMSQLAVKPEYAPCNRQTIFDWIVALRRQYNDCEMARHKAIMEGRIK